MIVSFPRRKGDYPFSSHNYLISKIKSINVNFNPNKYSLLFYTFMYVSKLILISRKI